MNLECPLAKEQVLSIGKEFGINEYGQLIKHGFHMFFGQYTQVWTVDLDGEWPHYKPTSNIADIMSEDMLRDSLKGTIANITLYKKQVKYNERIKAIAQL